MSNEETIQAVTQALLPLSPIELVMDTEEEDWLRMQVISSHFDGMDLAERIYYVIDLLNIHAERVCEERFVRVECYTPEGWNCLPEEARGYPDPEEYNGIDN